MRTLSVFLSWKAKYEPAPLPCLMAISAVKTGAVKPLLAIANAGLGMFVELYRIPV